jgi:hypothetical protein
MAIPLDVRAAQARTAARSQLLVEPFDLPDRFDLGAGDLVDLDELALLRFFLVARPRAEAVPPGLSRGVDEGLQRVLKGPAVVLGKVDRSD